MMPASGRWLLACPTMAVVDYFRVTPILWAWLGWDLTCLFDLHWMDGCWCVDAPEASQKVGQIMFARGVAVAIFLDTCC